MNGSDVAKVSQTAANMVAQLQSTTQVNQVIQISNGQVEIKMTRQENLQENKNQQLLFG